MAESKANIADLSVTCAYCGESSADQNFCESCGKVQPLQPGANYFAFMGLHKKLVIDLADLEKRFYSLSRQLHPDYFMNATPEERQASVDRASMVNDAYRTLRDPISRAKYLLTLEGYKEAEKKAPPDLLEEVFELNMQIEELRAAKKVGDADEAESARESLREAETGLNERLDSIDKQLSARFSEWDSAQNEKVPDGKAILDKISELLSHRSYVSNLMREIEEEFS